MTHRRNLFLAAAAAAAALAAPSAADAASCVKGLPAPGDDTWEIAKNGAMEGPTTFEQGANFAGGHGKLMVNGEAYPAIDDATCTTTATSVQFPVRKVGDVDVSRTVDTVGGRLRWVDTFVNGGKANEIFTAFDIVVTDDQHIVDSESGDATGTHADHWSVHQNDGGSFPFFQRGVTGDGAKSASLLSMGEDPQRWEPKDGVMPDAFLSYGKVVLAPGETVRLVHVSGTATSRASSKAGAVDSTTPLAGLSRDVASTVVNWGNDPDGDGVGRADDACPGFRGNSPAGCFSSKPVDPKPTPEPAPPADPPAVAALAVLPPVARDTKAPRIRLTKLPRSAKRSLLTRRGLAPRIACDEACSISVRVTGRARGKRRATTLLATKPTRASLAARTVRLKVSARALRRLAKRQVTVVVTVRDAAGNRRSLTRVVRIRR